jgi:ferredoxin-NADP reductase
VSQSETANRREKAAEPTVDESVPADRLADALFAAFVYVADVGPGITASDVDSLHAWVRRRSKLPQALQPSIAHLSDRFLVLWKRHVASGEKPNASLIADSIWHWKKTANDEDRVKLDAVLASLLDVCAPSNPGLFSRVRRHPTPEARLTARQRLETRLGEPPGSSNGQAEGAAAANGPASEPGSEAETGGLLLPAWPKRRCRLRCVAVVDETHDAKTFIFEGAEAQLFGYRPGQFITLELPIADGKKLRRSYTLSSSPSRPHRVSITVKRVTDGRGSNWLHEHVAPGFECNVTGPHGEFTCGIAPSYPKLLLIAAGSGITPIASMFRWLADSMAETDVVVINNVRTPDDVIFDAELRYLASRLGSRCRLAIVPSRVPPGRQWLGPVGRFSRSLLQTVAPDCLERQVYTCGPESYMSHVRELLGEIGLPDEQYHEESFGTPTRETVASAAGQGRAAEPKGTPSPQATGSTQPAPALTERAPEQAAGSMPSSAPASKGQQAAEVPAGEAIVHFKRSGIKVTLAPGDNLLDAAEENTIDVPSSCRSGNCGTCKVRKIAGDVDMDPDEQEALSLDEIENGWLLCCVSELKRGTLELDA